MNLSSRFCRLLRTVSVLTVCILVCGCGAASGIPGAGDGTGTESTAAGYETAELADTAAHSVKADSAEETDSDPGVHLASPADSDAPFLFTVDIEKSTYPVGTYVPLRVSLCNNGPAFTYTGATSDYNAYAYLFTTDESGNVTISTQLTEATCDIGEHTVSENETRSTLISAACPEPGVYSIEISYRDHKEIYENIITITENDK